MPSNGDGTRTGSVLSSDPRAPQQAASIGATIGKDGWWYAGPNTPGKKNGERLLPEEADKLTIAAGTAVTGPDDNAHDALYRDKEGRAIRGDFWKQGDRSRPAAKALGTALVAGGTLAALAPAAGAAGAGTAAGTAAGTGAAGAGAAGATPGIMDWLTGKLGGISGTDWLKTIGGAVSGYSDAQAKQQALAQQKEQFAKTYGLQNNAQQMSVQSQLNRAPLADLGQYGATHVTAPTAFQPRDYTQGVGNLAPGQQPQGGPQAQLAANQQASAKYTPGAGGVDTDTLKMILGRLKGAA